MNVTIEEIMHAQVLTAQPHQTVSHVRKVMAKNKVSAMPVVDTDNEPVGIVTATDMLDDLTDGAPVSTMMSSPVYTVPRYGQPHLAARIMRNHHIHHVVVTEGKEVVGIVSAYDLLALTEDHRYVAKQPPTPKNKSKNRS